VADVPGVLLHEVEQDPLQRRGRLAGPAVARLAHLVEVVALDDGAAARCLGVQLGQQAVEGLVRPDVPAVIALVAPRVGHRAALEPPLQPPQLDVGEVLDKLKRRPPGRQATAAELLGGQLARLRRQPVAEELEVAAEYLGPGSGRVGRRRERNAHGVHANPTVPRQTVATSRSSPVDIRSPSDRAAK
jgi:hypothetical protein